MNSTSTQVAAASVARNVATGTDVAAADVAVATVDVDVAGNSSRADASIAL